jgi:hypothetical protein
MVYVALANGNIDELTDASSARFDDDMLVCLDYNDHEVKRYDRHAVWMFCRRPQLAVRRKTPSLIE